MAQEDNERKKKFEEAERRLEEGLEEEFQNQKEVLQPTRIRVFGGSDGSFLKAYLLDYFWPKADEGIEGGEETEEEKDLPEAISAAQQSPEKKREINQSVVDRIKDALSSGSLYDISPVVDKQNPKLSSYNVDGDELQQEELPNGKYRFSPKGNFTGILRVERVDDQGNLIPDSVDVIEYKDGKPVSVIPGSVGESRVAEFGRIARDVGVDVKMEAPAQEQQASQYKSRGEALQNTQTAARSESESEYETAPELPESDNEDRKRKKKLRRRRGERGSEKRLNPDEMSSRVAWQKVAELAEQKDALEDLERKRLAEIKSLVAESEALRKEAEQKDKDLKRQQEAAERSLNEKDENHRKALLDLEKQLADKQAEYNALDNTKSDYEQKASELQADLKSLQESMGERERLHLEETQLFRDELAKMKAVQDELNRVKQQNAQLIKDHERNLDERLQDIDREWEAREKRFAEELEELKSDHEEQEAKLNKKLESQQEGFEKDKQKLKREQEDELKKLQEQLEKQKDISAKEKNSSLKDLRRQHEEAEFELKRVHEEAMDAEHQLLKNLQGQYNTKTSVFKKELEALRGDKEKEIAELKKQYKKEYAEKEAELKKLAEKSLDTEKLKLKVESAEKIKKMAARQVNAQIPGIKKRAEELYKAAYSKKLTAELDKAKKGKEEALAKLQAQISKLEEEKQKIFKSNDAVLGEEKARLVKEKEKEIDYIRKDAEREIARERRKLENAFRDKEAHVDDKLEDVIKEKDKLERKLKEAHEKSEKVLSGSDEKHKKEVEKLRKQLEEIKAKEQEATTQLVSRMKEFQDLEDDVRWKDKQLKDQEKEFAAKLKQTEAKHKKEITDLEASHKKQIQGLEGNSSESLNKLKAEHKRDLKDLKSAHEEELKEKEREHKADLQERQTWFEEEAHKAEQAAKLVEQLEGDLAGTTKKLQEQEKINADLATQYSEELSRMSADLEDKVKSIEAQSREMKQLHQDAGKSLKERDEALEKEQIMQTRLSAKTVALEDVKDQAKLLDEENARLSKELRKLEGKYKSQTADLKKVQDSISYLAELENENIELGKVQISSSSRAKQLAEEKQSLEKELNETQKALKLSQENVRLAASEGLKMIDRTKELERELEDSKKAYKSAMVVAEEKEAKARKGEANIQIAAEYGKNLIKQVNQSAKERERLEGELITAGATLKELKDNITMLQARNDESRTRAASAHQERVQRSDDRMKEFEERRRARKEADEKRKEERKAKLAARRAEQDKTKQAIKERAARYKEEEEKAAARKAEEKAAKRNQEFEAEQALIDKQSAQSKKLNSMIKEIKEFHKTKLSKISVVQDKIKETINPGSVLSEFKVIPDLEAALAQIDKVRKSGQDDKYQRIIDLANEGINAGKEWIAEHKEETKKRDKPDLASNLTKKTETKSTKDFSISPDAPGKKQSKDKGGPSHDK